MHFYVIVHQFHLQHLSLNKNLLLPLLFILYFILISQPIWQKQSGCPQSRIRVKLLLFHVDRSHSSWLRHLVKMPPERLPGVVFFARHTGGTMFLGWSWKAFCFSDATPDGTGKNEQIWNNTVTAAKTH